MVSIARPRKIKNVGNKENKGGNRETTTNGKRGSTSAVINWPKRQKQYRFRDCHIDMSENFRRTNKESHEREIEEGKGDRSTVNVKK